MASHLSVPESLPWWRSKIIVGAIVSILSKLLVASGLIGDLTPTDSEELTSLIVLLIGGIGDAVAIGSRVRQRHAPPISASSPPSGALSAAFAALLILLLLPGCATLGAGSPATLADKTLLDEKVGTLATNGYTAVSMAAAFAIRNRMITDPARIAQIGELDRRAFTAVEGLRGAYLAGNAQSYAAAIEEVNKAVAAVVAAVKGETP